MKETVFTVGIIVVIMTHVVSSRVIPEMMDRHINTSHDQSEVASSISRSPHGTQGK